MTPSDSHIGFAGVGLMGHGIALNLLKAGYKVTLIAHRNREPVEDLIRSGANEVTSYNELAQSGSVIMLCLSNSGIVESVIEQLLPYLAAGQIILDLGTSRPQSNRTIANILNDKGVDFAEAPLAGGPEQARSGQLGAMVGAEDAGFSRIEPLLKTFCAGISHFGPVGSGQTAKLLNNYLVCGMIALITETYNNARVAGIDWEKLFAVMQHGSNNSGALRKIIEPALSGDYDGYRFSIGNAAKDAGYYSELAKELELPAPLAQEVLNIFLGAVEDGRADEMVSRLIEPRRNMV